MSDRIFKEFPSPGCCYSSYVMNEFLINEGESEHYAVIKREEMSIK